MSFSEWIEKSGLKIPQKLRKLTDDVEYDFEQLENTKEALKINALINQAIIRYQEKEDFKSCTTNKQCTVLDGLESYICANFYTNNIPQGVYNVLLERLTSKVTNADDTHIKASTEWKEEYKYSGFINEEPIPLYVAHSDIYFATIVINEETGKQAGLVSAFSLEILSEEQRRALFRHEIQHVVQRRLNTERNDKIPEKSWESEIDADISGGICGESAYEMIGVLVRGDSRERELAEIHQLIKAVTIYNYLISLPESVLKEDFNSGFTKDNIFEKAENLSMDIATKKLGDLFTKKSDTHPSDEERIKIQFEWAKSAKNRTLKAEKS